MDDLKSMTESEAVSLLKNCEDRINELEAELESQLVHQKAIERRIIEIRSFRAPIAQLPKELLLQIFGWVGFDDPLHLSTILLVCKHWKETTYNSPTLWADFVITAKPDPAAIACQTRFVESAIRHSQDVPLDMRIHLPSNEDLWSQLVHNMLPPSHSHSKKEDEDRQQVIEWLRAAFLENGDESLVFYRELNEAILNHVRMVTGQEGWNLRRLRSLTIIFRSDHFAEWIGQNLFHYDMPVLEQLIVLTEDEERLLPDIFRFPAPQLARVATNFDLMFDQLVTREGQLTHLGVVLILDELSYDLLPNSRFTRNLTVLHIYVPDIDLRILSQGGFNFQFPVLKELAVKGLVPIWFINAPDLRILRLCDRNTCKEFIYSFPRYPKLEKLNIWAAEELNVREDVVPYLQRLPSLMELAFLYSSDNRLKECVDDVKEYARSNKLVVKGYRYSQEMFLRWFEVYDHTPVVEING
jgi:hypothetical protein